MTLKSMSYIIGVVMVGILVLSAFVPLLSQNTFNNPAPTRAAPTAIPTFPPPPDPAVISFDQRYLHPSGLFTVAEPTGWVASEPLTQTENVRAIFSNTDAQSIVQVDVIRPSSADAALTVDDVDNYFTDAWLSSSWREYTSSEVSSREHTEDDKLEIDFLLGLRGQSFVARQSSWTDGDWIYSVRVVMPDNATSTLLYVLDGVAQSLEPAKIFAATPFNWNAYFDSQDTHIIRFPSEWTLADSAPGRPTSIEGEDANTVLRVEADAGTVIDSEDAARAWVEGLRSGTEILSVEPVSREGAEGYSVAYSYRTVDGDTASGLAVLLNGPDEKLHMANLRFPGANVDLNAAEPADTYTDLVAVLDSFVVLPELANVDMTLPAAG